MRTFVVTALVAEIPKLTIIPPEGAPEQVTLYGYDWASDDLDRKAVVEVARRFDVHYPHGYRRAYSSDNQDRFGVTIIEIDYDDSDLTAPVMMCNTRGPYKALGVCVRLSGHLGGHRDDYGGTWLD